MTSIKFKDNRKGTCKYIFDPFVTTKRGQGNNGLTMYLVDKLSGKKITKVLNGSIFLLGEEGQGVQFRILFSVKWLI
jgi:signal transduction histidine kinase